MPKTKKTEEAVEKVKAAAETAKETVMAAAETAVEKAEVVVEKAKTAAKKVAKPRTKKAETAAPAEKAPRAKKAEKIETKVVIELGDKSASSDSLIDRAKEDWTAKGNSLDEVKELALYINAAEGMVYYVVNDDYLSGSFAI